MTDARHLTTVLGGSWRGDYGSAACPVCQPERRPDQRALSLANGTGGRLLLRCHKSGCNFTDILAAAGLGRGDWRPPDPAETARREAEQREEAAKRAERARQLWREAEPIAGTPAAAYLRCRGIRGPLPRSLRFHPSCWHGPTAQHLPAMLAAVAGAGAPAVHRTFLAADGAGKAPVEPCKMALGTTRGGAVRLSTGPGPLVVAEGIETALALLQGLATHRQRVWAALSASNMKALRLPDPPRALFVAPDGDRTGVEAAKALASRAAREGWTAHLMPPPGPKLDWADWAVRSTTEAA